MAHKIVTKKQHEILTLLYIFRFLNSKQLQLFLQHKDHRRINSWLKDLTEKDYVIRDFTPQYGKLTKPAVFLLSRKGVKHICERYAWLSEKYVERLRNDGIRSKGFRAKCQLVADCYLAFSKEDSKEFLRSIDTLLNEGPKIIKKTRNYFPVAVYEYLDFPLLLPLKPDMYMTMLNKKNEVHHAFINVIDSYAPRLMLYYTIKKIFQRLDEEDWDDENVASLQIYFVCPSNMVAIYLKRILPPFLSNYYKDTPLLFYFATRNQLYKKLTEQPRISIWTTLSSQDYTE